MAVVVPIALGGEMHSDVEPAYSELCGALWQLRENLDTLLYRLAAEQTIVSDGQLRWLPRAEDEVRAAVEALRLGEVLRAVIVEGLAKSLGLPDDVTLAGIADVAPEPWATLLAEHRAALRELTMQVQALAAENRRLLDAGAKAVRWTLDHLAASVETYDSSGGSVAPARMSLLLDAQA